MIYIIYTLTWHLAYLLLTTEWISAKVIPIMDHIPCFMLPPSPLTQHLYWTDGGYIMSSDCSYQCVVVRFNHVTSTYAICLLLTDQTLLPLLFQCCLRNICSLVKKFQLRKIIDKFFSTFYIYTLRGLKNRSPVTWNGYLRLKIL